MGHLIEWAQLSISSRFPNFTFQKADIFNKFYNPDGVFKAVDYRFPYEDRSFDLIFLTSVFTHIKEPRSVTISMKSAGSCGQGGNVWRPASCSTGSPRS